jgi:hypothetical protein
VTALGIAKSISEGLAKKVLAASVNGEVWDATRPIQTDAALKLLTWDDADGKNTFWHSSAHLLAEAVEMQFPGAKFWVGPALEKGFYYDIDLGGKTLKEEDVIILEKKMNELAKQSERKCPRRKPLLISLKKEMSINWIYYLDWKTVLLHFTHKVSSLTYVVDHIFLTQLRLKQLRLLILQVRFGKEMRKIKC